MIRRLTKTTASGGDSRGLPAQPRRPNPIERSLYSEPHQVQKTSTQSRLKKVNQPALRITINDVLCSG